MPRDSVASEDSIAVGIREQAGEQSGDRIEALQEHVARLAALVEQQQSEIAELRAERRAAEPTSKVSSRPRRHTGTQAAGRASSRRALLKWGGAAAAAATVAMVASERQGAHAAPLTNGSNVVLGHTSTNTAETATGVQLDTTTAPGIVLFAADNTSSTPVGAQYPASIGGYATGIASTVNGVYGLTTVNTGSGVVGWSSGINAGVGVSAYTSDTTNGNPALQAVNQGQGDGGHFTSANDFTGVVGSAGGSAGAGVAGYATGVSSIGVRGASDTGFGIAGFSTSGIDVATGSSGRFWQVLQGFVGAPTSGNFYAGEQIRDANGDLWICVSGNGSTTGSWAKVAHLAPGATSGGAITFLSKPIRLLDTRGGDPLAFNNGGGAYAGGSTHTLQVTGINWQTVVIPPGFGCFGKVTAVAGSGGGYIAIVPHSVAFTGTANVPFAPNQTVANLFTTALSVPPNAQPGALDIIIGGNTVDVVIDIYAIVS